MSTDSNTPHGTRKEHWHRRLLEGRVALFAVVTTVVISVGGIVEIVPMFSVKAGPQPLAGVTPYTPLEVAGRDIYIREGCYVCHSQMVRPMRAELQRYGEWTRAGELAYDRPFLLGSRRIGPDLQRVGGKYPDAWHFEHMRDPRSTSPGSIMPAYTWLYRKRLDAADVTRSLVALQKLGVPYVGVTAETVAQSLAGQGGAIANGLRTMNIQTEPDLEIIAVIAYLQRLGRDGNRALQQRVEHSAEARDASAPTEAAAHPHGATSPQSAPLNPHGAASPQSVPANPHGATSPQSAPANPHGATSPRSAPAANGSTPRDGPR
jgi:cbb3-type cytochrome c oxidase subunit II